MVPAIRSIFIATIQKPENIDELNRVASVFGPQGFALCKHQYVVGRPDATGLSDHSGNLSYWIGSSAAVVPAPRWKPSGRGRFFGI